MNVVVSENGDNRYVVSILDHRGVHCYVDVFLDGDGNWDNGNGLYGSSVLGLLNAVADATRYLMDEV